MPIQNIDLSEPIRQVKGVTSAAEDMANSLTIGNLTKQSEEGALNLEKLKASIIATKKAADAETAVKRILAEGADPASTHRKLLAVDPDAAEAYRGKVNADSAVTAPPVQQTREINVGAAPAVQRAAMPNSLDGTMGPTPPPETTEGERIVALPPKPRPYLTMGGVTEQLHTESARQQTVRQRGEEEFKSQLASRAKIAESNVTDFVNIPDIPALGIKAMRVRKEIADNIVNQLGAAHRPAVTGMPAEYEYAKSNGYKGTFEQYQNEDANRKRPAPQAEPGTYMDLRDDQGRVIAAWNPKSGEVKMIPGAVEGARRTAVPAGVNTAIRDLENSARKITDLAAAYRPEFVGPYEGRYESSKASGVLSYLPFFRTPDGYGEFAALNADLKNSIIKLITGAQMGVQEADRILKQVPVETDKDEIWKSKYEQTKKNAEFLLAEAKRLSGAGGSSAPSAVPGGKAPAGVDQSVWDVMTPQERALWQN